MDNDIFKEILKILRRRDCKLFFPCFIVDSFQRSLRNIAQLQSLVHFNSQVFLLKAKKREDETSPHKKFTKSNLPSKICVVCGRPFDWRKKWAKVWDEVKYCSDKCRGQRQSQGTPPQQLRSRNFNPIYTNPISQPSFDRYLFSRKMQKIISFTIGFSSLSYQQNANANAKSTNTFPTQSEIDGLFQTGDWGDYKDITRSSNFRRLDESNDNLFYNEPRFVEHIDQYAVDALTQFHTKLINNYYMTNQSKSPNSIKTISIMDLCSSWVSHFPANISMISNPIVGVGMNPLELARNPILTQYSVQDLNENPILSSYKNDSMDMIFIQLSIDYLTHPLEVIHEVSRILKPGGLLVISFINRVFIDKAVAIWTGKSDIEHFETIGSYLYFGSNDSFIQPYHGINIGSWFMTNNKSKSKYSPQDPIYAVVATKENINTTIL